MWNKITKLRGMKLFVRTSCTAQKMKFFIRDDTHMTAIKIVQFLRPPTPLVHLHPKFFHLIDHGRLISDEPSSPLQMITNQLKENIIQGWLVYVIRSFLQVGFRFHYQPINLVWLPLTFFHLAEASLLYLLLCGFTLLCVQFSENIKKCLLFNNYSHF